MPLTADINDATAAAVNRIEAHTLKFCAIELPLANIDLALLGAITLLEGRKRNSADDYVLESACTALKRYHEMKSRWENGQWYSDAFKP